MKKAVIILPTFNEKENISRLLPVLEEVFGGIHDWEMHVLVVDDNSPDGTADVVRSFARKNSSVHLHVNPKKAGLGKAYTVGMTEAFDELEADVAFEMDADFQHDPEKIPEFLRALDDGADMVVGSRYIRGGSIPAHWKLKRKFYSIVGNWINMVVFTNFSIHDWTGGFRAIRKNVFDAIRSDLSDPRLSGYTFQIGTLHKILRKGFKIVEVPFHFRDRTRGESKLGPDYITSALGYVLSARFHEIVSSHIFKFGVVGGIGFLITFFGTLLFSTMDIVTLFAADLYQKTGLFFFNTSAVAAALATECAIISNFILNNLFTFRDRKLTIVQIPWKFLQFNTTSLAALVISPLIVGSGTHITGDTVLWKFIWLVVATAIVMVINYTIYSKVIWKKNK